MRYLAAKKAIMRLFDEVLCSVLVKSTTSLGFSVDAVTNGEKNVVNNKFKLIFTPKTILLSVIDDRPNIPYQHLPPFVSFLDVLQHSQTRNNVVGIYNLHFKV